MSLSMISHAGPCPRKEGTLGNKSQTVAEEEGQASSPLTIHKRTMNDNYDNKEKTTLPSFASA